MQKYGAYTFFLLLIFQFANSQENHFSQFYTSPQYINPAFAGDAPHMKAGGATRIMQPVAGEIIYNTLLHYDIKLRNYNTGLGFLFYQHTEKLTHTKLQINYSHTARLSDKAWVKGGLGISFNQRNSSAQAYKYPDQYNNFGYTGQPTSEPSLKDNSYFPGLSAGFILYSDILWMSFSGDYLNMPNENFAGQSSTYPMKLSYVMGMLVPLNKASSRRRFSKFGGLDPYSSIGPVFGFTWQDKYIESSGGIAVHIKPIIAGIHYRYQHDFNNESLDYAYKALVLLLGYRQEEFSFVYSYDISFSQYTVNRSGAHEISAVFYFSTWKHDEKRHDLVPLPTQLFY